MERYVKLMAFLNVLELETKRRVTVLKNFTCVQQELGRYIS